MFKHTHFLEPNPEFIVHRRGEGIRLIDPKEIKNNLKYCSTELQKNSISNIFKLPLNIYFVNVNNIIQNMNDTALQTCGFNERKDAIGKTVASVLDPKSAKDIFDHQNEVIRKNENIITEIDFSRRDGIGFQGLTVEFPWYDANDEIIGVFGCSPTRNACQLAAGLQLISEIGLFKKNQSEDSLYQTVSGIITKNHYFTKRETECLYHLVRGKKAKEVAKALGLSPRTIEHYIENIKDKMNVSSKSELIGKIIEYFFYDRIL